MNKKRRIEEIDILKGIGIILVVMGHSGVPFQSFIYLFHMALFFISSGFLYKERYSQNLGSVFDFIKKKIKALWFPYFFWNAIFVSLNNVFIRANVYSWHHGTIQVSDKTSIKHSDFIGIKDIIKGIINGALFRADTPLGGAFWFLKILFFVSILYCVINFVLKKIDLKNRGLIQDLLAAIFLCAGWLMGRIGFDTYRIPQIFSSYFLYHFGFVFCQHKDRLLDFKKKTWCLIVILSCALLVVMNAFGTVSFNRNKFPDPFFLIFASVAGWYLTYGTSVFIKDFRITKNILTTVGKNTMAVVLLHLLCMKIVAFVIVKIYSLPEYYSACHPNLYGDKGWWTAYTIFGVCIPVLLSIVYKGLRSLVYEKK